MSEPFTKEFVGEGVFAALYEAEGWLRAHGYSFGSLCVPQPVAIMLGDYQIAKWKNLTQNERNQADGTMTALCFRTGPVKVTLKQAPREDV